MTLILRAIATAVVLGLLLPSSFQTETSFPDKTSTGNQQNEENSTKVEKKHQCSNTTEISYSELCNGYFDCFDGSDEICESLCSEPDKCVCANTRSSQCVSKKNKFHFVIHQGYISRLRISSTDPMLLECPLIYYDHTKEINWYLNDRDVPEKCQITRSSLASWLYCPNITAEDQGIYSCEQVSDFLNKINTIVFVKDELSRKMESSCYCFEATNDCETVNATIDTFKNVQLFSETPNRIHLNITNKGKTIIRGENGDSLQLKTGDTVYYALSEEIINRKLNLYGGSLTYPTNRAVMSENSPMALMRGDDKELVYYESGKNSERSLSKRISFSKHNWYLLHENNVSHEEASEVDVMKVLNNLDGIYIRVYYDANYSHYNKEKAELDIMKFDKNESVIPSSIEQCSCPPEYAGIYCERCADNYVRNVPEDNSCVPKKLEDEADRTQQNQSHFYLFESTNDSKPFLYSKPGNLMILECPNFGNSMPEEINWYQNSRGVPNKCEITNTLEESSTISLLQCPNMTTEDEGIYVCEQRYSLAEPKTVDVVVFVKNESSFEPDACFCFGPTPNCQKTNVVFEDEAVELFSASAHPILLKTENERTIINLDETIFEGKNLETILKMEINGTLFYALSEIVISKKVTLYGGLLSFKLSYQRQNELTIDKNSPLALMRGNNKVLVYYESGKSNENSRYKRLSFSKHGWYVLDGNNVSEEKATEADVLKVLKDLDEIYVKQLSVVYNYEKIWTKAELSTVKFVNNGSGVPSSIGKCSCPSGYAGTYCEKIAGYYAENSTKNIPNRPIIYHDNKKHPVNTVVEPKEPNLTLTTPKSVNNIKKYIEVPRHDLKMSDNDTILPPWSKLSPGSASIPSKFLYKRVDCLMLYFFSLCCSILWFRFL